MLNFVFGKKKDVLKKNTDYRKELLNCFDKSEFDGNDLILSKQPVFKINFSNCDTKEEIVMKMLDTIKMARSVSIQKYIAQGLSNFIDYKPELPNKYETIRDIEDFVFDVKSMYASYDEKIDMAISLMKHSENDLQVKLEKINQLLESNLSTKEDMDLFSYFFTNNKVISEYYLNKKVLQRDIVPLVIEDIDVIDIEYIEQKKKDFLNSKDINSLKETKESLAMIGINFYQKACTVLLKQIYDFDENKEKLESLLPSILKVKCPEEWKDCGFKEFRNIVYNHSNEMFNLKKQYKFFDTKSSMIQLGKVFADYYNEPEKIKECLEKNSLKFSDLPPYSINMDDILKDMEEQKELSDRE